MIKIAVCDDENKICVNFRDKIISILKDINITAEVQIFDNAVCFFKELKQEKYHIVFLDIDMPNLSGLEIAEEMMNMINKPLLIFVTNQDALVYQSFQYHPFGFIRKGYFDDEIERIVISAIDTIQMENYYYLFRSESETVRMDISDVIYFESCQNYVILYTKNASYRYRETLTRIEIELSSRGFIRIHKGFLINQEAVFRIGADEVTLLNGVSLPIGRTNKEAVKQNLMRYIMR